MYDWTDPGREANSTTANMTTPNQLMELPHPQSHDDASTPTNSERFVDDDKLAALSKGVVPACTDKCARWALTNSKPRATTQIMTRLRSTRAFRARSARKSN